MPRASSLAAIALLACGGPSSTTPTPDAPVPLPTHALGMNDVSILLPLPTDVTQPVLVTIAGDPGGEPLATTGMFGALVTNTGDIAAKTGPAVTYDMMHVVAVRFDLCDRSTAGPCLTDADGRLRLVLQPLFAQADNTVTSEDVAVHAFYAIPNADLDGVVRKLRGLAAIANAPDGPLTIAPGAGSPDYLAALHELVMTYAHQSNLQQITMMGQVAQAGAFEWHMRGYTRMGAFMPIQIPGTDDLPEFQQSALIAGGDITYNIDPVVDQPAGFQLAVDGADFDTAPPSSQMMALSAIVEVENPNLHEAGDVQCAACHVAELTSGYRAKELAVDITTLPVWYATSHDTSVQSVADTDARVVRAFGWVNDSPVITRRVANSTAEVVDEIAARFPP